MTEALLRPLNVYLTDPTSTRSLGREGKLWSPTRRSNRGPSTTGLPSSTTTHPAARTTRRSTSTVATRRGAGPVWIPAYRGDASSASMRRDLSGTHQGFEDGSRVLHALESQTPQRKLAASAGDDDIARLRAPLPPIVGTLVDTIGAGFFRETVRSKCETSPGLARTTASGHFDYHLAKTARHWTPGALMRLVDRRRPPFRRRSGPVSSLIRSVG